MQDYYSMFMDTLGMFLFLGIELSVLFLLISAAVSLLQQYIPDSKIQALLGGSKGRGYILAALIGAITPFCSCSTIPMLRGLLKAKAGFGPTLTFLFASPLLNPIILALFVATFGLQVSIIYTTVALITSIVAGYFLNKMEFEQYVIPEGSMPASSSSCCSSAQESSHIQASLQPLQQTADCCGSSSTLPSQNEASSCCAGPKTDPFQTLNVTTSCCSTSEQVTTACCDTTVQPATSCCSMPEQTTISCCKEDEQSQPSCCTSTSSNTASFCCAPGASGPANLLPFGQRVKLAFADAWTQFKQVFPYLLLGVSLGALVYGFVPSDFIAKYASGDSLLAVPIAAIIGIPLYVRVEALIPLSAVLVGKGMGLGAVMALIIGGGGASLTEVILLKSMFKMPMIIAFLTVILGMAITAGYLFQFAI